MDRKKIIIFRFSSFGDVAMTVPIIKNFINQNKDYDVIFVSQDKFKDLFNGINNLTFHGVNLKNYKGFFGLYKLFLELKKTYKIHLIIDLHNVLRTKILCFLFGLNQIKSFKQNKGRKEKKELTRTENKNLIQLKTTFQRYSDVFIKAGFKLNLEQNILEIKENPMNIGIAPFAFYDQKMFPIEKMKNIAINLANQNKKVFLFGAKGYESEELNSWENLHENIKSLAGKMSLEQELSQIKNLDVLISMDSANMHLASLMNVPCISIWGATHRFAGFLGFNQSENNCIEADVSCRPCSVFGNKKCFQDDFLCMKSINENQILDKIIK